MNVCPLHPATFPPSEFHLTVTYFLTLEFQGGSHLLSFMFNKLCM